MTQTAATKFGDILAPEHYHLIQLQPAATILDCGLLPVEELAMLAAREGRCPRPIYGAHRWFARRFSSVFRSLLVASVTTFESDFWAAYHGEADLSGRTVLDPFMGGGTSVVEAQRLGANVVGVDVDAVACAITRFELRATQMPDLDAVLKELRQTVGAKLAPYYRTMNPEGEDREALHYFWVQIVECRGCGQVIEAHPQYQLAYEAEGQWQWAFCKQCHSIQQLDKTATVLHCQQCAMVTEIAIGTVKFGRLTCSSCGERERLIDVAARTDQPPLWRLFAVEALEPGAGRIAAMSKRTFHTATAYDHNVYASAIAALEQRVQPDGTLPWIPERQIPVEGRSDDRLPRYGYQRYRDLFNPRQLLHLSYLGEAIDTLPEPVHEAMALAYSDHLITNCMMTHYAAGWRRLAPLFSVRAYRHVPRPVELNPWLAGTGRGTFPNAVRAVQRAINSARSPKEPLLDGGFQSTPSKPAGRASVLHQNSQRLSSIDNSSIDLALTDPPYFDNIAYSELSDFFLPWLQMFGLADGAVSGWDENLAARRRDKEAPMQFQMGLLRCFTEVARTLKPDGRLVFTYQHSKPGAWVALAAALAGAGFVVVQVFPLLGDGGSLHTEDGSSKWDAVLVLRSTGAATAPPPFMIAPHCVEAADDHYRKWAKRLAKLGFRTPDQQNFYRACLVAASLWMFSPDKEAEGLPLDTALEGLPPTLD